MGKETLLLLCILMAILSIGEESSQAVFRSCESLEGIELCEPLGYVNTTFPNPRGHQSYSEVNEELQDFNGLIASGCSLYLRHFLCAYYAPICRVYLPEDLEVPPCEELCTHVKARCEPVLVSNGYQWPAHLQCDLFPNKTKSPWCFGPENASQIEENSTVSSTDHPLPSLSIKEGSTKSSHSTSLTPQATYKPKIPTDITPTPIPKHCSSIPPESICASLGYNSSAYPNALKHSTKEEAEYRLKNYNLFLLSYCSPHLIEFLCYYYHPQCIITKGGVPVQPCRELCTEVKDKCSTTIEKFKLQWPDDLECSNLPSLSDGIQNCKMPAVSSSPAVTPSVVGVGGARQSTVVTSVYALLLFFSLNFVFIVSC